MNNIEFLNTYLSKSPYRDETLNFILDSQLTLFNSGNFKGKRLYDFSTSCIIHQLMIAHEFYPEITIMKIDEASIKEVDKWLQSDPGAFDWTYAYNYVKQIKGNSDLNVEENLKKSIKQTLRIDFYKDNLTDPVVLEQADCIVTGWLSEVICKDKNEYIKCFQKITKLLKPGGLLILMECLNGTFFDVGKEKYRIFKHDERFLRDNLANEGFKIVFCKVLDSKIVSPLTDYEQMIFVAAVKETS
ncbi:hypothetical protein GDO81_025516 [Engystomops pustulosus]|uniref:Uncharacterized protein n=1 Tax=Engystomops pustulosus TaxID=76066 RepID=A0AAV6ZMD0_ENGPU|nr:hypothetical protein GDO81_025516 [Engystomops pustulosus]